jgi:hypothetical protein
MMREATVAILISGKKVSKWRLLEIKYILELEMLAHQSS